ncbi:MAG: hypothetical protein G5Z42_02490 [Caldisphaeraceae archaeon]|nr:hypothetical protein [Caldisphaeraceae archaeon]MEB3797675.1 hypothetical protein [Caldisphaeraceae archaeon]
MPLRPNKPELLGIVKHKVMQYVLVEILNKNLKVRLNDRVLDKNFRYIGKVSDIIGNVEKPYALIKPRDTINVNDQVFIIIGRKRRRTR